MNNSKQTAQGSRIIGLSAKQVIIPGVLLILCLHAAIVANMFRISAYGAEISEAMQGSFSYLQVSKNFENNAEILTDKARLFVSTGNSAYLDDYFYTMHEMEDQGRSMRGMLQSRPNAAASEQIVLTLADFDTRVEVECHALRLVAESNKIDCSAYPKLDAYVLNEKEQNLSDTSKYTAAVKLLSDRDYSRITPDTHEHIGRAIRAVSEEAGQFVSQHSALLGRARTLQWIITGFIIVVLSTMMILLFVMLLTPLEQSAESISQGESLPTDKGVSEFRRLAFSYNELLHHKRMTESYLRKQSQTDALTKLPNRLAFQDYVSQLSWERAHSAVTVFSLDVNGLKEANDCHGHAYGDELLRRCASCILSVFGDEEDRRCFRFGGDEFAAFWVNVPQDEIAPVLERFRVEQSAHDVSISVGYASSEDLSHTSIEDLFELADRCMYEEKARHHKHTRTN